LTRKGKRDFTAPEQHVVVYDAPGQRGVVFDTAYNEGQMQRGRIRCISAKGNGCKARSVKSTKHFKEFGARGAAS
jgi:hypothetical protein